MKNLIALLILAMLLAACVPVPTPMEQQEQLAGVAGGTLTAVSAAIGGGFGSSGCTISSAGALSCDGTATLNGINAIGDGADTVTVNSSDWDISATGDMTGIGAITTDGAVTLGSTLTTAGDVTLTTDATGGNAGAKTELIGLPRIKLISLGAGTNGATETTLYIPAADPATSWVAISTTVTSSNDTSIRRVGANSLKLAFGATAVNDNGAAIDITNDDLEADNESIGFWLRSDTVLDAGDLDLLIDDTDAAPDTTFDVCAVATVNVWQWCEVTITSLTGGKGNAVDKIGIVLKDAAGLSAFNVWLDGMYKWDEADEMELNVDIPYDGVLSVVTVLTDETGANTTADLVEYTDYFANYQTSSDVIVWITDQSTKSALALVAYQ